MIVVDSIPSAVLLFVVSPRDVVLCLQQVSIQKEDDDHDCHVLQHDASQGHMYHPLMVVQAIGREAVAFDNSGTQVAFD